MRSFLESRVLVLDSNSVLMGTSSVRAIIPKVFLGELIVIKYKANAFISSPKRRYGVPEVVRWVEPVRFRMYRSLGPTRRNVFLRDDRICGYCGSKGDTQDHVFPRSRGGQRSWENIITACFPCNQRKGHRTPEEAGMPLLFTPHRPNTVTLVIRGKKEKGSIPKSWKRYLENVAVF